MKEPASIDFSGIKTGVRRSILVALSVFTYGFSFGVLARQAGLSLVESFLMSSLVFAGASQFVALEMWTSPLPITAIVFTTLAINLRHILMSAAISPWFLEIPSWKAYGCLFFLNDETWALTMGESTKGKSIAGFFLGSGLIIFIAWVSATVIGHNLGSAIAEPASWGLDFAFTAVFIALLFSMWQGKTNLLPWAVAAITAIVTANWIPGKWYILIGGLVGSFVGSMHDVD
jgi:4-azaleucine resistance transporter AzlC